MSEIIRKVKCFFGFHELVVDEPAQKLLDEEMKNPFAVMIGLNRLSDGTVIVFKECKHCGIKR